MNIVKKKDSGHLIQNLNRSTAAMEYVLAWKFQNAGYFLIVVAEGIEEITLEDDIFPVLEVRGEELVSSKYLEAGELKLYFIKEQEFLLNKNRYSISRQKLKSQTPYQVAVYTCELQENSLEVYEPEGKENRSAIPVVIPGKIRYKTPLFSRQTICYLTMGRIPGYVNGLVGYKPSCGRCTFPLSEACLGRDVVITLPKGESLTAVISEKYRQFYTIKIEEG